MNRYTSIMITAYSQVTGKSTAETIRELGADNLISETEITTTKTDQPIIDDLRKDGKRVKMWGNV